MANPRGIRRLAFRTLFEIDALAACTPAQTLDLEAWHASLDDPEEFTAAERTRAVRLAQDAFAARQAADAAVEEFAPQWPAARQAAPDRAVLRLAHFEMTLGGVNPRVAINEAVELAREFGTEKSPAFVNAVLDKIMHRLESGVESGAGVDVRADAAEDGARAEGTDAAKGA